MQFDDTVVLGCVFMTVSIRPKLEYRPDGGK